MNKLRFTGFIRDLEKEARKEGPHAVKELETFREHFRLAREVVTARRGKGLTQQQLSARTGINQSEISDIERGQANPTFRTLQTLAKSLGRQVGLVAPAVARRASGRRARRSSPRTR
jgi:ribosome-binding protein aMBF1 (putative translation factor)